VRAVLVIALLALPGVIFLVYSRLTDRIYWKDGKYGKYAYWKYIVGNYAYCSAVLYASAVVLLALRASFAVWVVALLAANAALVGFCAWMAILVAKGSRDLGLAWVFVLFPAQIFIMALALLARWVVAG
jgi:hypothetical protein